MSRFSRLLHLSTLIVLTIGIFGVISPAFAADPTPNVSVSWDKSSYAIGDKPRLTVIVTTSSGGLSGICVTYDLKLNGSSVQNNIGVCGTADQTDASGSATWLLSAFTANGSYTVNVTTAASAGFAAAGAATSATTVGTTTTPTTTGTTPTTTSTTSTSSDNVSIPNPISCNDATCLISQVIRYVLGLIAIVATLMFVWGGVMMLTSAGNSQRVERAKETLAWAAIGIVVILLSWGIIRFVLSGLLNVAK